MSEATAWHGSRVGGSIEMEHGSDSAMITLGRVNKQFYVDVEYSIEDEADEPVSSHLFPTAVEATTFYFLFIGKLCTEGWR